MPRKRNPVRDEFYVHLSDTKVICKYCPDAVFVESPDPRMFLQVKLTLEEQGILFSHNVAMTDWAKMINGMIYH